MNGYSADFWAIMQGHAGANFWGALNVQFSALRWLKSNVRAVLIRWAAVCILHAVDFSQFVCDAWANASGKQNVSVQPEYPNGNERLLRYPLANHVARESCRKHGHGYMNVEMEHPTASLVINKIVMGENYPILKRYLSLSSLLHSMYVCLKFALQIHTKIQINTSVNQLQLMNTTGRMCIIHIIHQLHHLPEIQQRNDIRRPFPYCYGCLFDAFALIF